MNATPPPNSDRRWLDWQPPDIMAKSSNTEPTKPSKPGFVGFEGSDSEESPEISTQPIAAPTEKGVSWADWKAAVLNQLFVDQGQTEEPGRITAGTVRHGEMKRASARDSRPFRLDCANKPEQSMSPAEAAAD